MGLGCICTGELWKAPPQYTHVVFACNVMQLMLICFSCVHIYVRYISYAVSAQANLAMYARIAMIFWYVVELEKLSHQLLLTQNTHNSTYAVFALGSSFLLKFCAELHNKPLQTPSALGCQALTLPGCSLWTTLRAMSPDPRVGLLLLHMHTMFAPLTVKLRRQCHSMQTSVHIIDSLIILLII